MMKKTNLESWVVYRMTVHGKESGMNAVCEQSEWGRDGAGPARPPQAHSGWHLERGRGGKARPGHGRRPPEAALRGRALAPLIAIGCPCAACRPARVARRLRAKNAGRRPSDRIAYVYALHSWCLPTPWCLLRTWRTSTVRSLTPDAVVIHGGASGGVYYPQSTLGPWLLALFYQLAPVAAGWGSSKLPVDPGRCRWP